MDDNNSGTLDIDEFTKAVLQTRLDIRKADIRLMFKIFDTDHSG
jgi:Ca2+-binding EF-hand superfamily protein